MFQNKTQMPTADQALAGREDAMAVTNRHHVKGTPIQPPFPAGTRRPCSDSAAFGAPSGGSGSCRVSTPPRSAMRRDTPPTRPTTRSAPDSPGTTRWCWWFSTREHRVRRAAAPVLGGPRSDPGNAPGQRRRNPVSVRDLLLRRRPAIGGGSEPRGSTTGPAGSRPRRRHHGDRAGTRLLLRRGLSPAVPGQEPGRLLRTRRLRRPLSRLTSQL